MLVKIFLVLLTPVFVVEGAVCGAISEPITVWRNHLQQERQLKEARENADKVLKQLEDLKSKS